MPGLQTAAQNAGCQCRLMFLFSTVNFGIEVLQGAHLVDLARRFLDRLPHQPACFKKDAFDDFADAARNWTRAGTLELARAAAANAKAGLPLSIDHESLALAWGVHGRTWNSVRAAEDGVCVRSKQFAGCKLGANQTAHAKVVAEALSLDELMQNANKLSQFAMAVLATADMHHSADVIEHLASSLDSSADLDSASGADKAAILWAAQQGTLGSLSSGKLSRFTDAVAADVMNAKVPSYSQGLGVLALAATDARTGNTHAQATVAVEAGGTELLSTEAGKFGLGAVSLNDLDTGDSIKAGLQSGDGHTSVAVQAFFSEVHANVSAEDAGLAVFVAFRALDVEAGVATGPVLSQAKVGAALVATVQACSSVTNDFTMM
jgi:hypothetical protein